MPTKEDVALIAQAWHRRMQPYGQYILAVYGIFLAWGVFRESPPPDLFAGSDKLLHFMAFYGFSLLAFYAIRNVSRIYILIVLSLIAVGSESAQTIVIDTREFDKYDLMFNILGVAVAYATVAAIYRYLSNDAISGSSSHTERRNRLKSQRNYQ